ncbi:hypothetical protein [Streptomyces sp. NPDC059900]|uniref:hypothetical protein n=1 Tax=Streptomyces sp. NPDC059900 TaxID=3155816 RepID=UPI003D028BF9
MWRKEGPATDEKPASGARRGGGTVVRDLRPRTTVTCIVSLPLFAVASAYVIAS